ncbi:glucan 1,4-alpha-glucosidase [Amycolatopsis sp. cg5]|uniref:glucan 1,4-alpha-glucosidase n=1 Tax=Amycolatopsis sp. cg5 TaxID=3238802 RepID=UPI0035265B71
MRRCLLLVVMLIAAFATPAYAAPAPGAPGIASAWTSGAKEGLGTSTTTTSKLWYTLGQGIVNEVYYPQADTPDVQDLQYMVSDGTSFTDEEKVATTHQVSLADPNSLTYQQVNTATNGRYRITKTYVTDPARATLLIRTRFQVLTGGALKLFALYNPSLGNSGMGDTGATANGQLQASDGNVASALASSTGFTALSSGYSGTSSDGWQDLTQHRALTNQYTSADAPGNLVQTAQIPVGTDTTFTLALGFGASRAEASSTATASLTSGWAAVSSSYQTGWHNYLNSVAAPPSSTTGITQQYKTAVMTIKAHEDKTYRGAFVASLSIPWGDAQNADSCCAAGYHAVWARDLYQMATAEIAVGDSAAANRALDYLFNVQLRPDGSYPQNTRLDGTPVFGSLQMDEVSFPIILAWQLGRRDAATYAKIKPSAEFVSHHGPSTPQERWEEAGGFSPSTLAAEIAALVCAADLATANNDPGAASYYLQVADSWRAQVDNWTYTTTGSLASHGYYERIDDNGNPNDGHNLGIANGGGNWDERTVVDMGFLDLVRLGVKRADDPHITDSLKVVDAKIRVTTPAGDIWYRYNHDGYGETADGRPYTGVGVGRLWPVLTGERGEYAVATGALGTGYLRTMAATANAGGQIPEQVWDRGAAIGTGTGSATPLAWAQAQFVRLAVSLSAGKNVETPSIVKQRYGT